MQLAGGTRSGGNSFFSLGGPTALLANPLAELGAAGPHALARHWGQRPKPRLCVVTQSSVEQSLYGGRRPNWRKPRSRPPRAAYGVNLLTVRGGGGLMAGPPIVLCSRGRVLLCSRGGPRPAGGDPPPGRRRPQPAEASPSLLFPLDSCKIGRGLPCGESPPGQSGARRLSSRRLTAGAPAFSRCTGRLNTNCSRHEVDRGNRAVEATAPTEEDRGQE